MAYSDDEMKKIAETYAKAAATVMQEMEQTSRLEGMMQAPAPLTRSMKVRLFLQYTMLPLFELLTWPTLALICVRLWMK